jgi:hypothetical protein
VPGAQRAGREGARAEVVEVLADVVAGQQRQLRQVDPGPDVGRCQLERVEAAAVKGDVLVGVLDHRAQALVLVGLQLGLRGPLGARQQCLELGEPSTVALAFEQGAERGQHEVLAPDGRRRVERRGIAVHRRSFNTRATPCA